ncbi:MAG: hypothetical protein ACTHN5_23160 [Phycisphaerae bacterium]
MRSTTLMLLAALALLTGCNSYNLRYKAVPQPANRHLYADFTRLQDSTGIYVDTDGRRLEELYIRKPDGTIVRPARIDYPGFGRAASIGPGIGIGPVGVGVGFPVGPKRAEGLTTATFPTEELGPPPWEVHVKVEGTPEATIPGVGGPATSK